jgi:hypothetical protein
MKARLGVLDVRLAREAKEAAGKHTQEASLADAKERIHAIHRALVGHDR